MQLSVCKAWSLHLRKTVHNQHLDQSVSLQLWREVGQDNEQPVLRRGRFSYSDEVGIWISDLPQYLSASRLDPSSPPQGRERAR
jgi:hypothetical protein